MKQLLAALVIAICLVSSGGSVHAYPYYQLSSGNTRCNLCHYAPAGGGLLNNYGREESGDTVSRGGDGGVIFGLVDLPDWLAVGADLRFAALVHDAGDPDGAELAAFPMQADLAARVSVGPLSLVASVGHRGSVRQANLQSDPSPSSDREEASALSALISREHYVQWMPETKGPYLRAGRFYAPFGLRLPDHTTYVRRYTGFNLLEETYGVSGGWVDKSSEIHVTAHISDRLRWSPRDEVGATLLFERHSDSFVYGASSRVAIADDDRRITGGLFAKYWMEGPALLWMAEVDVIQQTFTQADADRLQLVVLAGPVWIPTQGVYVGATYELFDEDIVTKLVQRHAVSLWMSYQPYAHIELAWLTRGQLVGTKDTVFTSLLQVHYYL